jgi:hypothetical protein
MVALALAATGCGAPAAAPNSAAADQLKVLGILYGRFVAQNGGNRPANEGQLSKFLDQQRGSWEGFGLASAKEFLASPRDGQPLVVLYGAARGAASGPTSPYVARESAGVDGVRLAVDMRGGIESLAEADWRQHFSPAQHLSPAQ